jgi:hypothetical protein
VNRERSFVSPRHSPSLIEQQELSIKIIPDRRLATPPRVFKANNDDGTHHGG